MRSYEISKVNVDGRNMTVVTRFGDDHEDEANWLHVVFGYNRISRFTARRWVGARVYTLDYYREAAQRFNEIQSFIDSRVSWRTARS